MSGAKLLHLPRSVPAVLAGLLVVVGMVVPVPSGPRWEDGHARALRLPLCMQLTDGKGLYDTFVPSRAQFSGTSVPGLHGWYIAAFSAAHGVPDSGWWRPYGVDSVEIRWHHSPSIRLRIAGEKVRGSAQPAGAAPPVYLLMALRPRPVTGTIRSCGPSPGGPPNVSLQQTGDLR